MSRMKDITVLIYEEEAKRISQWTLQYPHIETGGDLFGLWQSETEVVIQLVIGPGVKCRRTPTSFFQDERYLGDVGTYLTSTEGLCNIGEWHSHHSLNLSQPSSGDRQTVWRNMPRYGLKRFLLLIATIKGGRANTHSFMFTSQENASRSEEMFLTNYQVLPGPNPFRALSEVQEKLNIGAEVLLGRSSSREFKDSAKQGKKDKRKTKKLEMQNRKREKKENRKKEQMEKKKSKRDEKAKKNDEKEMKQEEKDERAKNETPKYEEKKKDSGGKKKRRWPKYKKLFHKKEMDVSSPTANDQESNQHRTENSGPRVSEQDWEETGLQVASSENIRSSKPLCAENQQKKNKESKPRASAHYSVVSNV